MGTEIIMIKTEKKDITKLFILFVLFVFLLYSCKKENEKRGVLKTYFPKDKEIVFSEYLIKNEDTLLDGKYIVRKYNGEKIKSGAYKNGKSIGPIIFYFDNGNIESIDKRNNNKSIETIFNYRNGKIERYTSYDDFGKSAFIVRFDEQSNVKSYEGYPLMETYQYKIAHKERFKIKINQVLKVGDTLRHNYLVANIPNAKRSLKIENLDIDNAKIKRIITEIPPTAIDVKEVLTKKGINNIRAIVKYKFNDKEKTVINDTVSFEVNVN